VRGCESGFGENSNEPTCAVKDSELNDELSNFWLFGKEFFSSYIVYYSLKCYNSYGVENIQSSCSIINSDETVYYSLS